MDRARPALVRSGSHLRSRPVVVALAGDYHHFGAMPDRDPKELELIAAARERARLLYEGREVQHRSCGIALAETFGLPSRPYQALRRGGITGEGECGAVKAGELVLGELLGDPAPTGLVTPKLRQAMVRY